MHVPAFLVISTPSSPGEFGKWLACKANGVTPTKPNPELPQQIAAAAAGGKAVRARLAAQRTDAHARMGPPAPEGASQRAYDHGPTACRQRLLQRANLLAPLLQTAGCLACSSQAADSGTAVPFWLPLPTGDPGLRGGWHSGAHSQLPHRQGLALAQGGLEGGLPASSGGPAFLSRPCRHRWQLQARGPKGKLAAAGWHCTQACRGCHSAVPGTHASISAPGAGGWPP